MRNKILASLILAATGFVGQAQAFDDSASKPLPKLMIEKGLDFQQRLADDNETSPLRPRLADDNETSPLRPRLADDNETSPLRPRLADDNETSPLRPRLADDNETSPLRPRIVVA
jgi:hypothetical protein